MAKAYGVLSPGESDTEAPTVPGGLTGSSLSATSVRLSWQQSTDNIGVAGYQIFRDGAPIDTTTNLTYDDTGLSPSTQSADLMTDCPIPALPGDTFGDVVDYSVQLITALKKCNAKLRTLREQEARRCEIEETDR